MLDNLKLRFNAQILHLTALRPLEYLVMSLCFGSLIYKNKNNSKFGLGTQCENMLTYLKQFLEW